MTTEAQKKASLKYCRANTFPITIRLNRKTDADLIQMLEGKNKNAIIKEALRIKLALDASNNYCKIDETA